MIGHDGRCHCCRKARCVCGAEKLGEELDRLSAAASSAGDAARTFERASYDGWTGDPNPLDDAIKPRVHYVVKPYEWSNAGVGRSGTSYMIMEQRCIATSRSPEDADTIAKALNAQRGTAKQLELLTRRINTYEAQIKSMGPTVSLDDLRSACVDESLKMAPHRWSALRKDLTDFHTAVVSRLRGMGKR